MMNHDTLTSGHKVVISGISGLFPNSDNVAEFQENLLNKVDCVTEHDRWHLDSPNIPKRMGVCNNINKFDRVFFGVHIKLTAMMDPMARLMLEHCFGAIMDAGINPRTLKGANLAVFVATNISESEKAVFNQKVQRDGFGIMGCSKAMNPNRVSFFLGLTGPSVNVDSGCTGSATALECAYRCIKEGQCDGALVAGCQLCLHPHISYQLKVLGLLSRDGYTRSFDDHANGHSRSEGIGVLFLQRADLAKRVYQEVVNVKTVHTNSREVNSILYPSVDDQIQIMREVLKSSGLTPDDIAYLEASGVAIRDADAEELEAITAVYGKRKKPLPIGAIKSIVGNATPVNTINSIVKMIIASETGQIPANLYYEKPNSMVDCLKSGRIFVNTDLIPWTGEYTSVNTTSICGVFGNVILKAPNKEKKNNGVPDDDMPRLVIASGRTEEAVGAILNYTESKPVDVEFYQLLYDIFQTEVDSHLFRGYTIVPAKGLPSPDSKKQEILFNSGDEKEIWWIFSGMGSQWVGMGEALLRLPVFEASIRKCDAVLKPLGFDIFKIITDKDPTTFDHIINSFVGIAAIQIGLVDVLRVVGLEPDHIIGHSVGELGCAYADGCFTAEQMILAALSRGLASSESPLEKGSMAAVGLGYEDVKPLCPPDIDVACHNGPDSSTISGPAESMRAFVASLTARGIFAREVPSSNIAYHSRYIAPAGPKLLERLQKVIPNPNPRSPKWVSTSVPRGEWNTVKARLCSAEYHTNNLLSPVLFEETSRQIPADSICIEIAPHGLLQAILKKSLPESCINIPLTRRGHPDNLELLLGALGKMYNVGLQPQISNLYPKVQYPVSRGTASISSLVKWDHATDWIVNYYLPARDVKEGEKSFEINLDDENSKYLKGYVIDGKFSIPLSLCFVNTWEVFKTFSTEEVLDVIFEDIKVKQLLVKVPADNVIKMIVVIAKGTGKFEVLVSDTLVVSGTIRTTKAPNIERLGVTLTRKEENYELTSEDFYTELRMRGFQYSKEFRNILKSSTEGSNALIEWNGNWVTFIDSVLQLYIIGDDSRGIEMPLTIRKIIIDHKQHEDAKKNPDGIHAIVDKKLNYISVGGLEIQDLKFSGVPKTLEQNLLNTDTLAILPNVDRSENSITSILRLILQVIIENTVSQKIQRIQLIGHENSQYLEMFSTEIYGVPEFSLFKIECVSNEEAKLNRTLNVITDVLKTKDFKGIAQKLGSGKFLLTFINCSEDESYIKAADADGLKTIIVRKNAGTSIVLFRKTHPIKNFKVVNASKDIQKTVSEIKNTKVLSSDERIVVVMKSKDEVNLVDLINHLKNVDRGNIKVFFTQDPTVAGNPFSDHTLKEQLKLDLFINILTPEKKWSTLRRKTVSLIPKLCKNWTANQEYSHDPASICWTEGPVVKNTENTIKIEYAGLNVQDILIANGSFYSLPSENHKNQRQKPSRLGLEFSGSNSKGKRLMGVTGGNCLSDTVEIDSDWTWNIPESWSYEDAATVPLSYLIAYSALIIKAEIKPGEKVLISNSCSDVGLATLHLAIQKKCEVFTTYETETEKKLIHSTYPSLSGSRLLKSSKNCFRDAILFETKGQGVDVVISNQCEIKQLEVFFTVAKRNARVVLISDLNENKTQESVGMEIFLKEISLYSVVPKKILTSDSKTKKIIANLMQDGINNGSVKPLPRRTYTRDSLNESFKALLTNENLGKLTVKVQPEQSKNSEALAIPRLYCEEKKSYLIIEGLTNFGLELVDWLITRGARRFIVASSTSSNSGYKKLRFQIWQSYGVQIIQKQELDFSQLKTIKALFNEASSLGPVDAVFDLRCMSSKIPISSSDAPTKIIDEESRSSCPELRLFIVCSSMKIGERNDITTSNAQDMNIEEILDRRRKNGYHGLFIKWGLENSKTAQNDCEYINLPPITKYLQKLDEILGTEERTVEVSCVIPSSIEVEEDVTDIDNSLTPEQIEEKIFTADLYKEGRENPDGLSSDFMTISY